MSNEQQIIGHGRHTLTLESKAIQLAAERLNHQFYQAVEIIDSTQGKVVVCGLGKSGHIGQKIASTLASTGTSAFFLHASEAMHGDFGMISQNDCLFAISYSGETREVLAVVDFALDRGIKVISLTGNIQSSMSKVAHAALDGSVEREADSLDLAPTSSSTVALALGDAVAVALMKKKNFSEENFKSLHPGGKLGNKLATVRDFLHKSEEYSYVGKNDGILAVLQAISIQNCGICAILDEKSRLIGSVTDGDLRRSLLMKKQGLFELCAGDIMTTDPKVIVDTETVLNAISLMERNNITTVFVRDADSHYLGIVRLYDLMLAKII